MQRIKNIKINLSRFFKKSRIFILLLSFTPMLALAGDDSNMLSSILSSLTDLLTSDIAKIIFILSIIGVGYGWLYLGSIPKGRAIGAIVGIGIVFSAGWIARQLGVGV
jgi:type IV secretory pathway VirB2 component (pilin)